MEAFHDTKNVSGTASPTSKMDGEGQRSDEVKTPVRLEMLRNNFSRATGPSMTVTKATS